MKSFSNRAELEVRWRKKNKAAINTVAKFLGLPPLVVGSVLSGKILKGRRPVFERGELIGYA